MCRWLALLLLSCGPSLPERVTEYGHFRYHHREDDEPPCAAVLEQLQALATGAAILSQRPLEDSFVIDYYRFRADEQQAVTDLCEAGTPACASGTKIYTTQLASRFAVAHAVLSRAGTPPASLQAGLAEVLGCQELARWAGAELQPAGLFSLLTSEAWLDAPQNSREKNTLYTAAFVRFLIERHGVAPLVQLYASVPYDASAATIEQHFSAAFGANLADELTAFGGTTPLEGEHCLLLDDPCDAQPGIVVTTEAPGQLRTDEVTCAGSITSIEVSGELPATFRFIAEQEGRRLELRRCDHTGTPLQPLTWARYEPGSEALSGRWMRLHTELLPGRYTATVTRVPMERARLDSPPAAPGGTATLTLEPSADLSFERCDDVPLPIRDDEWYVALQRAQWPAPATIRLAPETGRQLASLSGALRTAQLCATCDDAPAGCRDLGLGGSDTAVVDTSATLLAAPEGPWARINLVFSAP